MIFNKTFETQINLTDINDIFSINADDLILNKLKTKYENKCYNSSFILNVNRIINRSELIFNKRSLNAYINVNVIFEAQVLHYEYLDIICDNNVIDTTNKKIICKSEHKSIIINNKSGKLNNVNVNQHIPIIVGKCSYSLFKNVISINSYPFVPILENKTNIYYKIEKLNKEEIEILNTTIIPLIENETNLINKMKKDKDNKILFFTKLLYPFKKELYKNKISNGISEDLLSLKSEGVISLLNESNLIDHNIHVFTKYDDINVKDESALIVYQIYLNKYYKYLKAIRELSESYSDNDKFKEHKNIFDIYEENKF